MAVLAAVDEQPDAVYTLEQAVTDGIVDEAGMRSGALPATVRVWRRSRDGSASSCDGEVQELPLEEYVSGVLPSEWLASWESESLKAGAIAIRTYTTFWVLAGGKYACADVDDTTWTQVYDDVRAESTTAAVKATKGQIAVLGGGPLYAEYSAENTDLTEFGVADPHCEGKELFGHGRGMCQWGSQRWAQAGRDAERIVTHYYPGARVVKPGEPWLDGSLPLRVRTRQPTPRVRDGCARLELRITNRGNQPLDGLYVHEKGLTEPVAEVRTNLGVGRRKTVRFKVCELEEPRLVRYTVSDASGRRADAVVAFTLDPTLQPEDNTMLWVIAGFGATAVLALSLVLVARLRA